MDAISIIIMIISGVVSLSVAAVFGAITKKFKDTADIYEKGRQTIAKEAADAAKNEIVKTVIDYAKQEDEKLQEQINQNQETQKLMKAGLLSIQGRAFKKHCRDLLEKDHFITVEEYEEIISDHDAYNGLGGNHLGDMLFSAVVQKYNSQQS